jgi:peptidoglycan hydrolase-like protein with peptidoglycan-binding domain
MLSSRHLPATGRGSYRSLFAVFALLAAGLVTGFTGSSPAAAATLTTTQVQMNLAGLAYLTYSDVDGADGPKTQGAVKKFQIDRCMDADGAAGPRTGDQLVAQMKLVQGKVGVYADGLNGPTTKQAIINYQKANGLTADGMAGAATFAKMGLTRIRVCGGPIVGSMTSDSSTVACFAGTRDLGVHDAYAAGTKIRARLCAIPGFKSSSDESRSGSAYYVSGANGDVIVNARASGTVMGVYRAAINSGVAISATSSFRTMAHQQALCNGDSGCRNGNYSLVARPGYSNHQLGAAIDYSMPHSPNSGATCTNNRDTNTGDALWNFLFRNASRFSIRQYAVESWHWETVASASSTRC